MTKDLNWIGELLGSLPIEAKKSKTLLDIARFPRRETVISNLFSYYLKENEEHGFHRLFLDALLRCMVQKNGLAENEMLTYNSTYSVRREINSIDLLIEDKESKWAIIIENKVDHWLHNRLDNYWNAVMAKNKKLVVLSLDKVDIPKEFEKFNCINICYEDFISNIDIKNIQSTTQSKHKYYLEDFIQHLKRLKIMFSPEKEQALQLLQNNMQQIKDLNIMVADTRRYVVKQIYNAFEEIGYHPYNPSLDSVNNHFFCTPEFYEQIKLNVPKGLRFFVRMGELFESNLLTLYFELYDDYTIYGETIQDEVRVLLESVSPLVH